MLNDVVIANKTYAKMNISANAQLDNIAINVIRQDIPDFILPMKMINIDGETEIRYELGDGTRLTYLPEVMSKKDFMILMENMLRPFKTCNDWFLDYHKFYLDKNYIIVGRNNSGVRYIYIPDDEHANTEEEVLEFFRDFLLSINLTDDQVYIMNLYRLLREKNASLLNVLDYLVHDTVDSNIAAAAMNQNVAPVMQQRNMAPTPPPAPAPMQAPPPVKQQAPTPPQAPKTFGKQSAKSVAPKVAPTPAPAPAPVMSQASHGAEFGKSDMQGALISNLFGEVDDVPAKKQAPPKVAPAPKEKSNKGGLFGGLFGGGKTNAPQQQPVQQVPMQNPGMAQVPPMPAAQNPGMMQVQNMPAPFFETEDVTCIGGIEEPVQDGNLISMQLEEDRGYQFPKYVEIDLSKGYATVGRFDKAGNPQADFNFEASLSFVSRRHFRIEKAGDAYKIVDLGSGNGTMLNSQVLVPNMPYPMKRGDRITISKNHKVTYRVC